MSNRYKGGVISATPPTTTGGESGTASGAWTLEQQMQLTAAGLWPIQPLPKYIEDVFSTYLYTGTGATQSITNNIDVTGEGALVWIKRRNSTNAHFLFDTARGVNTGVQALSSNTTDEGNAGADIAFTSTGFTLTQTGTNTNGSGATYASWTFRKQPKFFDIVTWTGNDTARTIAHNLGSVPGCIIVKATSAVANWYVYHRSTGNQGVTLLNTTDATFTGQTDAWNSTTPTASVFSIGNAVAVNSGGVTYVAYLFAHDAGGFGLNGTDNVISCGSFTGNPATINLGWEPQFLLWRPTGAANWSMIDSMREFNSGGYKDLIPNSSGAEAGYADYVKVNATGFTQTATSSDSIYIAIRRGPMAVPTSGTSVFAPLALNNSSGTVNTTGFPIDLQMQFYRPGGISPGTSQWIDRLRGFSSTSANTGPRLYTTGTEAEVDTAIGTMFSNTGFSTGTGWANVSMSYNNFRRAPGFFDEVCYTGTGSATTQTHNLGVVPELMIIKSRTNGLQSWYVYSSAIWGTGIGGTAGYDGLRLDSTAAAGQNNAVLNSTQPTASVFSLGTLAPANESAATFVNYLFATCAGVSKVGSYLGTGATQTIACGFTGGARFVLIKRADSTGDWYVWDSARGIIAGNDPYLLLNSTAAEVTNTDYVDTAATGFEISSTAPAAINANGGTFIFLAIA